MKLRFKEWAIFILLLIATVFTACDKKISDTAFGNTVVYIPQAIQGGGINNNYLVPSVLSYDTTTNNFNVDSAGNKVNVYLGVLCSGLQQALAGYSVTVSTRSDTINQLIANGLIQVAPNAAKTVVLLPTSAYSLPTSVTVPSGQYQTTFYLTINRATLKTYAGKKVALCVVISSPTLYTLSAVNQQVIIIIDVDSLKLL